MDSVSLSSGDIAVENYINVNGSAKTSRDIAGQAAKLRDFLAARAEIYQARVHLLEELIEKVAGDDAVLKHELD